MMTTIEISMYPLQEGYVPPIDGFIALLNQRASATGFKVLTYPTCTVICGAYDIVFSALQETIAEANETWGKAVYVTKIIPNYEAL
ncbi:MAG: hypothetical protein V7721_06625 [Porticoccaceae bacterium]